MALGGSALIALFAGALWLALGIAACGSLGMLVGLHVQAIREEAWRVKHRS